MSSSGRPDPSNKFARHDALLRPFMNETTFAGDPIPPACEVIELRMAELRQLFKSIDPSPFHEKDLDADAEEFIVSWAREAPHDAALALKVHLDRPAGLLDEAAILRDAVHQFFRRKADSTRRRLRQLFRVGRTSLLIGILFLASSIALGDIAAEASRRDWPAMLDGGSEAPRGQRP